MSYLNTREKLFASAKKKAYSQGRLDIAGGGGGGRRLGCGRAMLKHLKNEVGILFFDTNIINEADRLF